MVPKEVVERDAINPQNLIVIPSYDHTCCWEAMWPAVLAAVDHSAESTR